MTHDESTFQTKKALCSSLKELMKHKAFSKITICEIVSESHLNRKTFYYHFDDTYDLLKWMIKQDTLEIINDIDIQNDYQKTIRYILNYFETNTHLLSSIYDAMGHDILTSLFNDSFSTIVLGLIHDAEEQIGYIIPDDYRTFLCDVYIASTSSMIINSIKQPERYNQKNLIDYFNITLPTLLPASILAYSKANI